MSRYIDADVARRVIDSERSKEQMLSVFDSIPTANVRENVHGKWILHKDSKTWECSKCGKYQIMWSNFCPNCGADMRGDKDENNN